MSAKTSSDFLTIKKYYEAAIESAKGKQLGTSLYELSQLYMNTSFPYTSSGANSSYIFELLVKAADLGQPDAQFQVGAAYATGVHLTQVLLA